MSRLTDEQLANFEASLRDDARSGEGLSVVAADDVADVFAELRELRELRDLATKVVDERRAQISHARESTAMCRLAKAVDTARKAPPP